MRGIVDRQSDPDARAARGDLLDIAMLARDQKLCPAVHSIPLVRALVTVENLPRTAHPPIR